MSDATTAADVLDGDALAFRVDRTGYRWRHVVAHARRRGDWQALHAEIRHALACLAVAEQDPLLPDRDAERELAVSFRRARRLHAAEDVEAWLAERNLTVAQWRRWVRGETLRRRHAAQLEEVVDRDAVTDDAVRAALPLWGWCSGALPSWARVLAERAAAAHAVTPDRDDPDRDDLDRDDRDDPDRDDLDDLADLEQLFDRFTAEVATPDRLAALVERRHLDWLRIECETVAFGDRDTAAEALLCIRDDGWSLEEAAAVAEARLRRHTWLVEEVEPDVRHHFVRARDGDLLGPLSVGEDHALVRVLRKQPPDPADDEVRLRATRQLVGTAVDRAVADRVQWLHPR